MNTDLAKQLNATTLGARLWRLEPGQASTRHRHMRQDEMYVLLEGRGRVRVGGELLTLEPLSALYVEADTVRQVFKTPRPTRCGWSWVRRRRRPTRSR
jgi:quercetin dioxygenase-like cupin family protein